MCAASRAAVRVLNAVGALRRVLTLAIRLCVLAALRADADNSSAIAVAAAAAVLACSLLLCVLTLCNGPPLASFKSFVSLASSLASLLASSLASPAVEAALSCLRRAAMGAAKLARGPARVRATMPGLASPSPARPCR